MPEDFLTITQVAAHLGIRERVIQRHVDAGTIPYRRIGKAIQFRWRDIEAWWESLPGKKLPVGNPASRSVPSGDKALTDDTSAPVIPLRRGAPRQHSLPSTVRQT
jgi:excisionase family DNA binding protein